MNDWASALWYVYILKDALSALAARTFTIHTDFFRPQKVLSTIQYRIYTKSDIHAKQTFGPCIRAGSFR